MEINDPSVKCVYLLLVTGMINAVFYLLIICYLNKK